MKFFILLLLVASFSNGYGLLMLPRNSVQHIEKDLLKYFNNGLTNFTGSQEDRFILSKDRSDGELGQTEHALVWKGAYTNSERKIINQTVAVKIIWEKQAMDDEMAILNALNTMENIEIEKHGIPRVYYRGPFLKHYYAIAMTLFDGTVRDRYENEWANERSFPDLTILSILKQAIEGLKYLNSMHVIHNDIKPENIFYRGEKVFIGDFDLSTINGTQNEGHTPMFASANFYGERPRHPMDDLESLIYSMWYIADVPMVRNWLDNETEGFLLNECNKTEAIDRVLEKCSHFKNPRVYEVFKYISIDEMLSGKPVPAYDICINKLTNVIEILEKEPQKIFFNWLSRGQSKVSKRFGLFD